MSEYISYINYGTFRLGEPTGQWVQDADGWWREVYTDAVWFDQNGVEERREPPEAFIRMSQPHLG